ncbi:polysaccharide biosynthesis protein [Lactococcus hodotermopsidis]|uniref:Polysaccharide biosynthesis protein n=1 Tax=Pseudolactococcus hodotermopsidis TaxID=2709157 RepID=A0A6A0BFK3_9LACT|nr:polysaccharide biosynthesis protein [Lactococcus hodotermopsidis]GFH43128.1 polysaccharide biosynthesis protein [Lactococcus hodotermopsidis]
MENAEFIEEEISNSQNQQDKMLAGTFWMTAGDFLSKILGAIYIIPWYAWMGSHADQANALFSMGYNVYALFLLISTAGIPVAISREVAHYNALRDYNMSYRLVRQMLVFMAILGVFFAGVMYLLAPFFATLSGGGKDLIPVMKSLSLAVLIFPSMSVIRGYFQGLSSMKPYALSQLMEQLVRVIWMLVTAFTIMKVGSGDWVKAVTQSTTAAFIGMIASLAVLIWSLMKQGDIAKIANPGQSHHQIDAVKLLTQTLTQAIPFIVIGSAIQIFKLIDQSTFPHVMKLLANYTDAQLMVFFSYFSANTDKLTMVLIGVATTLGGVSIPLVTSAYVKGEKNETAHLISYSIQLFSVFMIPAVVGMSLLAREIYTIFYVSPSQLQLNLFIFAFLQSFLLAAYAMLSPMLQALHHSRTAMKYFAIALGLKLLLQVPAIYFYESYGPMIATTVSFALGVYLFLRKIQRVSRFSTKVTIRGVLGILFMTLLMSLVVVLVKWFMPNNVVLKTVAAGGMGFSIYLILVAKLGYLEKLLGEKGTSLRRKLHI